MKKHPKNTLPASTDESSEAKWWFETRKAHGENMLESVKTGDARVLTKEKLLERIAASKKKASPVVAPADSGSGSGFG